MPSAAPSSVPEPSLTYGDEVDWTVDKGKDMKKKEDKSHCALCDAVLFRRDTVNPHPSTSFTLDTHQPKDDTCS